MGDQHKQNNFEAFYITTILLSQQIDYPHEEHCRLCICDRTIRAIDICAKATHLAVEYGLVEQD